MYIVLVYTIHNLLWRDVGSWIEFVATWCLSLVPNGLARDLVETGNRPGFRIGEQAEHPHSLEETQYFQ